MSVGNNSRKNIIADEIEFDASVDLNSNKGGKLANKNEITDEEQIKISKEFQEQVVKFVKLDDLVRKREKEI